MRANLRKTLCAAFVLGLNLILVPAAPANELELVRTMVGKGQLVAALNRVRTFIDANPTSVEGRLLEGVVLTRLDRPTEAIEAFRSLAALQPGIAEPHNNLAVLYARTGQFDAARESLERAVELQPDYGVAHENLGDVYAKLASLAYERASTLGGSGRAAEKALAVGELLGPDSGRAPIQPAAQPTPPSSAAAKAENIKESAPPNSAAVVTTRTPSPTPAAVAASSATACFALKGGNSTEDLEKMQAWLQAHGAMLRNAGTAASVDTTKPSTYVVYLPPRNSRAAAEGTVSELKAKGMNDVLRFPRGDLANGISLGVFSSEEGALRRQEEARKLGFGDARYKLRDTAPTTPALVAMPAGSALVKDFATAFPDGTLAPATCP